MRKNLFSLIALAALTFDAGAQWMRPAREVWSATNTWTFIPTTNNTSQKVHDWLDDYLVWANPIIHGSLLDGSSWTYLPDTNAAQAVFDWIDSNWPTTNNFLASTNRYIPGTNIIGATRSGHDWTLPASGVPVSTSSWEVIDPASSNAQAVFDFLDDQLQEINSNLTVQSSAGAANAQHNNGFVSAHPYVVPATGYRVVTSFMSAAYSANTNVLNWSATPGRLEFRRDGGYLLYATVNATNQGGVSFAYWYVYNSLGVEQRAFPITTITSDEGEGAGLGVVAGVSNGWYAELGLNNGPYSAAVTTHVGSVYVDAFKLYNKD